MSKQPNLARLRKIYTTLLQHPGTTRGELSRLTGHKYHNINGLLTTMESNGFYLSEDQYGRLYPFKPEKVCNNA